MPIAFVLFFPLSPLYQLLWITSMNLSDHAQKCPCPIFKAPSLGNMLWRPCALNANAKWLGLFPSRIEFSRQEVNALILTIVQDVCIY